MEALVLFVLFLIFAILSAAAESLQKRQKTQKPLRPVQPAGRPQHEDELERSVYIHVDLLPRDKSGLDMLPAEEKPYPAATLAEPAFSARPAPRRPAREKHVKRPAARREDAALPLFGRHELVKAVIFSEILGPPVAARRFRRN
ncbi:MAG: hypothetical protein QM368_03480 [Bacillota bacterium]|jgi:hypothetical protein|nr:hypothetical protein [Bacillota bacterium]HHU30082.1 hypothetical protein [Bacillota bacterium]